MPDLAISIIILAIKSLFPPLIIANEDDMGYEDMSERSNSE